MRTLLWGGQTKSRIALAMLEDQGIEVSYIFDPYIEKLEFSTKAQFSNNKEDLKGFIDKSSHFLTCIGGTQGYARYKISEYLKNTFQLEPVDLISEHAIIDKTSVVGEGFQAMPGAVLHKFCTVGDYSIINSNATVDHECVLGDGVHIMGGASVAGCVHIDDYASIGTNATILPRLTIGKGAVVGAGAVVTKNVSDNDVVSGVPARHMKNNELIVDMSPFENL